MFLDLQDRTDGNKLREPELFLERHRDHLVCMDEIQLASDDEARFDWRLDFIRTFLERDIGRRRRPT